MQRQQVSDHLVMIHPVRFGFNVETAATNVFQQASIAGVAADQLQAQARAEFDGLVRTLQDREIQVTVFDDTLEPHTPDSIFPNNWFSTHEDGALVLYPMLAPNRRLERRADLQLAVRTLCGTTAVIDLTPYEARGQYLEGTGSLVLDRVHRVAYAALSERTHPAPLADFGARLGYEVVRFETRHPSGVPVYHTNVLMAVGEASAVVCLEAIADASSRRAVAARLEETGHAVIELSAGQMDRFAGNLLQVRSRTGQRYWVCSSTAYEALSGEQRRRLEADAPLLCSGLEVIERCGGGSARCMLAELFAKR